MFAQLISEQVGAPSNRRGARGYSHNFAHGFAGLSDLLTDPVTVNEHTYTFGVFMPPMQPDGWYVMSPEGQEQFVLAAGGQLVSGGAGPAGGPAGVYYTLANGHTVIIPANWNSLSTAEKLTWIEGSNLSAADSVQLETEAGVASPVNTTSGGSLRPTLDYVRTGDVVRVAVPLQSGLYIAQGDVLSKIAQALRSGLGVNYVNGATPGIFGGSLSVDVQAQSDFAHLIDVASIVQSVAQGAGGIISTGPATATFVSKVEQTGGHIQAAPPPAPNPNPFGISNTNLLLLGAGGVLLLVVLAKK